jgi:murein tripeptide amidase MpaA
MEVNSDIMLIAKGRLKKYPTKILKITVVSSVYRAENILEELVNRILSTTSELSAKDDLILVDDFSPDKCWLEIERLAQFCPEIKGIKLSRNLVSIMPSQPDWMVQMGIGSW